MSPERRLVRDALVWGVIAMVATRVARHFFLHDVPHAMDEAAYLFQAKTFATGHLAMPSPEPRGAFNLWFVWSRGLRYSVFPPAWPALLGLFLRVGLEHWANPFVHGVTVALGHAAVERSYPRGEDTPLWRVPAHLGALLLLLSPQLVVQAASLMSHPTLAACSVALLFALPPRKRSPIERWQALVMGTALGIAMLARPLCALALALTLGVVVVARRHPITLRIIATGAVPLIVAGALFGAYNKALTGSLTTFPQTAYFEQHEPPADDPVFRYVKGCNALGFGPSHSCDIWPHTVELAIVKVKENLRIYLVLGAAAPLLCAAGVWTWRRLRTRPLVGESSPFAPFAVVVLPLTILLYSTYWNAGTCLGARFYQITLPPLLLAFAVSAVRRRLLPSIGATAAVYVVTLGLALGEVSGAYFGLDDRFHALKNRWTREPALVMVVFADPVSRWGSHYRITVQAGPHHQWWNSIRALSALAENEATPGGTLVFAKFHPALAEELVRRYPGRTPLLYVVQDRANGDFLTPYRPEDWTDLSGGGAAPNFGSWGLDPPRRGRLEAAPGTFFHDVGIRERAP